MLKSVVVSNLATNTFFRIQATANGQDLKLFLNGVEGVRSGLRRIRRLGQAHDWRRGSSSVYQHRADNCAALGASFSVAP